ncbi:MAG: hypothetical protein OER22_16360 [Gammaproteobacteria bacterium]|nr:hypothetical protein [Gammaproteobacteria bacterium]MDH3375015.1 hypothetical protein [Gammaproteobacteria bacterium]MDH3409283.1 hypothetical protein [Gammaproteobacteria bacterium]MDH3554186.1 hypothetical protein [Gammaproteobacteria bacterium]
MNTEIINRLCVLLVAICASSVAFGQDQDCSEPFVTFGEVNAGLQAGFTGGIPNSNTLPSGHFLAAAGIEHRGFISPLPDPNGPTGWLCEVDGVQLEVVETAARWAVQPDFFNDTAQVLKAWGAFIELYSLEPGFHTATLKGSIDLNCFPDFGGECDGIPDIIDDTHSFEFEVAAN